MSLPTSLVALTNTGRRVRCPNGVDKPIALRLPPELREKVQRCSADRNISMAAFCTECFRRGLTQIERESGATAGDR